MRFLLAIYVIPAALLLLVQLALSLLCDNPQKLASYVVYYGMHDPSCLSDLPREIKLDCTGMHT